MAWIEAHQGLLQHRKTFLLAEALDVSRHAAVGYLITFWQWALDNAPEGDLTKSPPGAIAVGVEWGGDPLALIDALVTAGWADREGASLTIHNWWKYAGRLIDRRKANAERVRAYRARNRDVTRTESVRNGATVPYPTVQNSTIMWVRALADLPGWETRGAPHFAAFRKLVKKKGWSEDELERAVAGLAIAKRTPIDSADPYENLIQALTVRLNNHYDQPGWDRRNSGRHDGDVRQDQGAGAGEGHRGSFESGPFLPVRRVPRSRGGGDAA